MENTPATEMSETDAAPAEPVSDVVVPVGGGLPESASGSTPGSAAVTVPLLTLASVSSDEVVVEKTRTIADRLGICLSALCMVHCLMTPVLLVLIPSLEVSIYHELFHESLLFVLPVLALVAFLPGYRRHRDLRVFAWSVPGLALVAIGALLFHDEVTAQILCSVAGSALLIRAHVINRRLCACCQTGHGWRSRAGSAGVGFRRFKVLRKNAAPARLLTPRR